jgi:predicted peptidase
MKRLFYIVVIAQLFMANLVLAQTNARPVVSAGGDKKLAAGTSSVILTGTASDPDGTITKYAWTRVKGPSATLTNADQSSVTITNLKKGVYIFRLTVTDNATDVATNTAYDEVVVIYDQPVRKTHTRGGTPTSQLYYWEYLPEDYATSSASKKYPLIVFLHGCGERSYTSNCDITVTTAFDSLRSYNELDKVLKFGPPNEITGGVKMCFKNPDNVEECFIVLSPQLSGRDTKSWGSGVIQNFLTKAFDAYPKIDRSRVYLTGLSLGGIGTYGFALSTQSFAPSLAAIAPVAAQGNAASACTLKDRDIPVWAFHGDKDTRVPFSKGKAMIDSLKKCNPDPMPRFTVYAGQAHSSYVFNTPYKSATAPDPDYPEKLYEWFLQFQKGAPVVNAGTDKTITLPTNSVTFTGSATDPDGISTYQWTKQSGPSATLSATNQPTLTVSNMAAGSYIFRLTATDTKGMSGYDEVGVVVNAAPGGGSWLELTSLDVPGKSIASYYSMPNDNSNQISVRPGNDYLEFYLKNISGPTDPQYLRLELTVKFSVGVVIIGNYISEITPTWTKVAIPLNDFAIASDRWTTGGVSQVKFKIIPNFGTGVFGVDEIRFTGGANPVLWYGDAHQESGSAAVVVQDPTAFYVSNRPTSGGAPAAGGASARLAPTLADDTVGERTLTRGSTVHVYNTQGAKIETFICPGNCSLAEMTREINYGGLYILHVVAPSGNMNRMKVNIVK